jgi:hypothetical protein
MRARTPKKSMASGERTEKTNILPPVGRTDTRLALVEER